jgi:hypothetical protein
VQTTTTTVCCVTASRGRPQALTQTETPRHPPPPHAQHIGIMVASGVDDVQWRRITLELPEIIPRGAHGWERYY